MITQGLDFSFFFQHFISWIIKLSFHFFSFFLGFWYLGSYSQQFQGYIIRASSFDSHSGFLYSSAGIMLKESISMGTISIFLSFFCSSHAPSNFLSCHLSSYLIVIFIYVLLTQFLALIMSRIGIFTPMQKRFVNAVWVEADKLGSFSSQFLSYYDFVIIVSNTFKNHFRVGKDLTYSNKEYTVFNWPVHSSFFYV